jgi:hypothetical protein
MTNLINLIDGVDGLAGGIALMLMVLLAVVGGNSGIVPFVAAGMVGALLGFLRYNFPPARIYLGDGGAFMLGFLVGCLTIRNSHKGTVVAALIAPLFVLALPILDTSLALVRRGLHGLPLFRADRRHLHHRLLESGLSRRNLTLSAYAFTALFLVLGLGAFAWEGRYDAIAFGVATLVVLLLAIRFRFSRQWFGVSGLLHRTFGARSEIQYAIAQSRWLGMQGARGHDLQTICEDTAFAASKIGFVALRIHLHGSERKWEISACPSGEECGRETLRETNITRLIHEGDKCRCYLYHHQLPAHQDCWIELQSPDLNHKPQPGEAATPLMPRLTCPSRFGILAELLAEAWAKSTTDYARRNGTPLRFLTEMEGEIESRNLKPEIRSAKMPRQTGSWQTKVS